jgi:hypothetical protein
MRSILRLCNHRPSSGSGVHPAAPHLRALLLIIGLLATFLPVPLAAQDAAPLTLEVTAGFDGAGQYRSSHWMPVLVTASNDGTDLRGQLVWRFPGDSGVFRYDLDLPRGARKQIPLAISSTDSQRSATVSIVANGNELARTVVRLAPVPVEQMLIGVISSDANMLNTLSLISTPNNTNAVVTRLDPTQLPSDAMLLTGLDVIFIHDLQTDQLAPEQLAALELWTRLGGQLVVGGGIHAEATTAALAAWLPVEVGPLRSDVATDSLGRLARRNDLATSVPTLTANTVTLRPGARNLDDAGLISSGDFGAGQVYFAAFDLEALRPWAGEANLWERVVRPDARMIVGQSFRWRSENLLRDTLQLPALRLPSIGVLALLVLGYIVVIGPLNFLLLRRLRRVELAWITTPALVALFLALTYGSSFVLRGNQPQLTQLAIVQGFEGSEQAQSTTFLGLFSPQRRSYMLQMAPETLITPGGFEGFQFRNLDVTTSDTAARVDDLLVDVSSLRTLITEHPASAPQVTGSFTNAGGRWQGEVRNGGNITLENVLIVRGTAAQDLGTLAPGATVDVDLDTNQFNFPDAFWGSSTGLINRYQVTSNLFNYDRFNFGGPAFQGGRGMPEADAMYLLGWATTPALDVTVDAATSSTQGEILYIIRLDDL